MHIKVFDKDEKGAGFERKVSTDVTARELVHLGCFRERYLNTIHN